MSNDNAELHKREVRSFAIRSGRMTESQQRAFDTHLNQWSLPPSEKLDLESVFSNKNACWLEIGFGMGDSLFSMAGANQDKNFIGIEVHRAGVGRLLRLIDENKASNIRVYMHDAVEVLKHSIPDKSIERINIYFPDPWHKKKHHKRRLVKKPFLDILFEKLSDDGYLHIATDWLPYSEHVLKEIELQSKFIARDQNVFVKAADYGRPETKFERRGLRLGHEIRDMVFKKRL